VKSVKTIKKKSKKTTSTSKANEPINVSTTKQHCANSINNLDNTEVNPDSDHDSDLNIDKFNKSFEAEETEEREVNATEEKEVNTMEEREVNIEVEGLPIFVRTEEGGKTFEFEFIDKCKDNVNAGEASSSGNVTLKRKDKSELKKTLLQSKFQRLGMLKVANFKEQVQKKSKKETNTTK
jgi:hypothetical protein